MTGDSARAGGVPLLRARRPATVLTTLVLLRWSRALAPMRNVVLVGGATLIALSAGATVLLLTLGTPAALVELGVAVSVALAMTVPLTAALLAVVAGCAGADLTSAHRLLLNMPVRTRSLALALAAPGLSAAAVVTALLWPPLAVLLAELTGYGVGHALGCLLALTAVGLLAGRLIVTVVRAALARNGWLQQYVTTVAVAGWLLTAAGSVLVIRSRITGGVADELAGPSLAAAAQALTGWPALLSLVLRPRPAALATTIAVLVVLLAAVWASAGWRAGVGVSAAPRSRARVRWQLGQAELIRLAAHRVLRNRRTLSWLVTSLLLLWAMSAVLLRLGQADARTLAPNALLLCAQLAAYPALLARGLDRRDRPPAVQMGLDVRSYTWSWQCATALLCGAVAAGPLMLIVLATGQPSLLIAGACMSASAIAVAQALSSTLVPRPGDAAAETVAGVALFGIVLSVGLIASRSLGTTDVLPVAAAQALVLLPAALLPARIEARRWHRSSGQATHAGDHVGSAH